MNNEERLESIEEAPAQIAIDLNVIKCLLITEHATRTGKDPQELAERLHDIYHSSKETDND